MSAGKEIFELQISGFFQSDDMPSPEKFGESSLFEAVTDKNLQKLKLVVGTSDEVIPLGDVTTPKRIWCHNCGLFPVRFRSGASGNYDVEVLSKSQGYWNWNGAALHAIAIGGNTAIRILIGGV